MQSPVEERLARLEQSVRRFRCIAIVLAILIPTTAAVMQNQGPPAPPANEVNNATETSPVKAKPAPTGRTHQDVLREYDSHRFNAGARQLAVPEVPPRPLKVVDAEVFVVLDQNGNVRTEMGVDPQNKSCFKMYDATGRPRIELAETSGTTTIKLMDQTGTPLVQLQQSDRFATISLASDRDPKTQTVKLEARPGESSIQLNEAQKGHALKLDIRPHEAPQLSLVGAGTEAWYSSNGLHVNSDAGNLAFYLTPNRNAALSLSACRPVAGQESIQLSATPGSAQMQLRSLASGANALVHVSEEVTALSLKPKNKEAVLDLSISDRKEFADSRILMQSTNGQESIQLNLGQVGPSINIFEKSGLSVFDAPR